MNTSQVLTLAAAASGTVGSILTACSVSGLIQELDSARRFNSLSIKAIALYVAGQNRDVPIFKGLDENHDKAQKKGNLKLWIGISLLAIGFILQTVSMVSDISPRTTEIEIEYAVDQ